MEFDTKSRLYRVWVSIRNRCSNPRHISWKIYGGRGITVCQEWQRYATFRDWAITHGYRLGLSIDRIDNDGHYCPENCRFADRVTQANNTRKNLICVAFGERKTLAQWCRDPRCAVTYKTLYSRINQRDWDFTDALVTPPWFVER